MHTNTGTPSPEPFPEPKRLHKFKSKFKNTIESMKSDLHLPKTRQQQESRASSLQHHNETAKKRPMSAQRVSLFKHPNVIVNIIYEGQTRTSSADTLRKSSAGSLSEGSTPPPATPLHDDAATLTNNDLHKNYVSGTHSKQSLGYHEPFEIYEIKTMDENNISIGCYLSIGKNDKVVKPILPKLKIIDLGDGLFHIPFSSPPTKLWELIMPGTERDNIEQLRECFVNICQLECPNDSCTENKALEMVKCEAETDEDDLDDFLNTTEEDTDSELDEASELLIDEQKSLENHESLLKDQSIATPQQQEVNNLFKKTVSRFRFSYHSADSTNLSRSSFECSAAPPLNSSQKKVSAAAKQKRYSSYELVKEFQYQNSNPSNDYLRPRIPPSRNLKNLYRRSISVPMEFQVRSRESFI
ncbi:hypothetical protein ACO0QE_003734 [Hanseniaspora vineae]